MYELALFAGGGGGLLGTRLLGWQVVCYVEKEKYAVEILKARIRDGYLDDAPIWDDAETFDGKPWTGFVDVVTAGFPCQPFSYAGKRLADEDERNMWPATIRIVREVRPRYVLLENSPNLLNPKRGRPAYFGTVLADLAASGYDCRWDCIPASAVGANHQRDRVWVVAHTNGDRRGQRSVQHAAISRSKIVPDARDDGAQEFVADAQSEGKRHLAMERKPKDKDINPGGCSEEISNPDDEGQSLHQPVEQGKIQGRSNSWRSSWWKTEPRLGRVVDELAHRVDRLKAIGNGQVPAVVAFVWESLNEFD